MKKRMTVTVSPKNTMTLEDWKAWGQNAFVFLIPVLIVFFTQLQQGVPPRAAGYLALVTLYGVVVDFMKKYKNERVIT